MTRVIRRDLRNYLLVYIQFYPSAIIPPFHRDNRLDPILLPVVLLFAVYVQRKVSHPVRSGIVEDVL